VIDEQHQWAARTSAEIAALDGQRAVALLPVGAIEQHGPHLPLDTDTAIVEAILAAGLSRLPAGLPVLALPTQAVGWSLEHGDFCGTLSASATTAIALWTEIGRCVARAGVRKLVLFNGHGGQPEICEIVARTLRADLGMMVVPLNWFGFGQPPGVFPAEELALGIHAGALETALMLHIRPHAVRTGEVAAFASATAEWRSRFRHVSPQGPAGFAWLAQDLNPAGAVGDARLATAAAGAAILDHAAGHLANFLTEMVAADWPA
jgi:creatinine amidohydrolase